MVNVWLAVVICSCLLLCVVAISVACSLYYLREGVERRKWRTEHFKRVCANCKRESCAECYQSNVD